MDQETKGIVFKGNSEGLVIVIPREYDFEKAKDEIEDKVESAARFFKGARMKVTYRGIALTAREEEEIKLVLDKKAELLLRAFQGQRVKKQLPGIQGFSKAAVPARKTFFSSTTDEGACKFVKILYGADSY